MRRIVVWVGGAAAASVVLLVGAYLLVTSLANREWKDGIYLSESDIEVVSTGEEYAFDVGVALVGSDVIKAFEEQSVGARLTEGDNRVSASAELTAVTEEHRFTYAWVTVTGRLPVGVHEFEALELFTEATTPDRLGRSAGHFVLAIREPTGAQGMNATLTASGNNHSVEIYAGVENTGGTALTLTGIVGAGEKEFPVRMVKVTGGPGGTFEWSPDDPLAEFPITVEPGEYLCFVHEASLPYPSDLTYVFRSPAVLFEATSLPDGQGLTGLEMRSGYPIPWPSQDEVLALIKAQA
jgi:hypothetical protein